MARGNRKEGVSESELEETEQLRNTRWTRKTLLLIAGVGFLALVITILSETASPDIALRLLGTGMLIAGAAFLVGVLLGFLFGIPRTLQGERSTSAPSADGTPTGGATEVENKHKESRYEVNTNLEQISDWLTKILVGVGLTQLYNVPDFFVRIARYLVEGSRATPGDRILSESVALTLVVFFVVDGFLSGYLMTRLFLAGAFSKADDLLKRAEKQLNKLVNLDLGLDRLSEGEREILRNLLDGPFQLEPSFERESEFHNNLRSLKRKFLIKPREGSSWQPGKTVEFTPIGRQVEEELRRILRTSNPGPAAGASPGR
jgi:hypothetical protein